MSVRDLRRARGEATRSALLEAAIESVALHGLSGTTLSTVAEQAGVIALWFAVWDEAQSLALYRAGTLPHDRNYTREIRDLAAALTDDAPLVKHFTSAFTFYSAGIWLDYHLDLERYDADGKIATGQRLIAMLS